MPNKLCWICRCPVVGEGKVTSRGLAHLFCYKNRVRAIRYHQKRYQQKRKSR